MPAPAVDAVTDEYIPQGAVDDVLDRAAKAATRGPDISYRHGKIVSVAGTTGGYVATTATGVLAGLPAGLAFANVRCAEIREAAVSIPEGASFRRELAEQPRRRFRRSFQEAGLWFYPEKMLDLGGIDVEEIATALADQTDYEHRWLIDPRTGQVAFWTSDTGIDGENPVGIDELDLIVID